MGDALLTSTLDQLLELDRPKYYRSIVLFQRTLSMGSMCRDKTERMFFGLVVFSVALGIVISRLGDVGKPLYDVFYAMAEASMKLVIVIIW